MPKTTVKDMKIGHETWFAIHNQDLQKVEIKVFGNNFIAF